MPQTQIMQQNIADGAVNDAKVQAGANIATSKLADGANFLQRNGSVALTGNLDAGNNRITNLTTPSANGDATNKSYVDGLIAALPSAYKYRDVRAATTGNITISNPGTAVFDGVTLTSGQLLLVRSQSAPAENGIYTFNGSGSALTRATNSDAWDEIIGCLVFVNEGSTLADTRFYCTSNTGGTLGTTAITYTQDTGGGLSTSNFVWSETPAGSINGSNTAFTLANTPTSGTLRLHHNGLRLQSGAGNDFTISGANITMTYAPATGSQLLADYMK